MIVVNKSPVHGYGVFSTKEIKKDEIIVESIFIDITDNPRGKISEYMFGIIGARLVLPLDRVAIINHSDNPNVKWELRDDKIVVIAILDIPSGDELFLNYGFCGFKKNNALNQPEL